MKTLPTDTLNASLPHPATATFTSTHAGQSLGLGSLRAVVPALGALLLSACAVTTEPMSENAVRERVQADQFRIYNAQEQVFKPITFSEALARALKYNLDYRLKLMETALSQGLSDVSRYDMLPNLVASAGYASRDNLSGSRSFTIVNGEAIDSNPPTYTGGQDRTHRTTGVELSWNVLDFGVGYYRAKQQGNQVMIAEERRRRVVQNILNDVRSAYWRAVGAQRLAQEADLLTVRVRSALERSREAEQQGLVPPREALGYQRLLLDAVNLLSSRRQEVEFAKRELAALMNITPGTPFSVAEEDETDLIAVPLNVAELEELALLNRPELRQEDYQVRITAAEARKQLMALLPNLSLNVGAEYDSNSYLYNNNWTDTSARVSFNLLRSLSIPATRRAQDAQVQVDDMRRMALSMAVLTQVRVAVERYRLSLSELEVAKDSYLVDQRLAAFAKAALSTRADSELELIRAETRALNSAFQRYGAYAAAQAAYGRIYNSVGLEVVPGDLEDASVAEIGRRVTGNIDRIEKDTFSSFGFRPVALPAVTLQLDGLSTTGLPDDAGRAAAIAKAVQATLQRNRVPVSAEAGQHSLRFALTVEPAVNGTRRATWLVTLTGIDGRKLGETRHTSSLLAEPSASSLEAFAQAAAVSSVRPVTQWLQAEGTR